MKTLESINDFPSAIRDHLVDAAVRIAAFTGIVVGIVIGQLSHISTVGWFILIGIILLLIYNVHREFVRVDQLEAETILNTLTVETDDDDPR